jgi:hypothetical protein
MAAWGATPSEVSRALPGDDVIPDGVVTATSAVTMRPRGLRDRLRDEFWGMGSFVMERGVLLGIKKRAEAATSGQKPAPSGSRLADWRDKSGRPGPGRVSLRS